MPQEHASKFCPICRTNTEATRVVPGELVYVALLVACPPIGLLLLLIAAFPPLRLLLFPNSKQFDWRCTQCGSPIKPARGGDVRLVALVLAVTLLGAGLTAGMLLLLVSGTFGKATPSQTALAKPTLTHPLVAQQQPAAREPKQPPRHQAPTRGTLPLIEALATRALREPTPTAVPEQKRDAWELIGEYNLDPSLTGFELDRGTSDPAESVDLEMAMRASRESWEGGEIGASIRLLYSNLLARIRAGDGDPAITPELGQIAETIRKLESMCVVTLSSQPGLGDVPVFMWKDPGGAISVITGRANAVVAKLDPGTRFVVERMTSQRSPDALIYLYGHPLGDVVSSGWVSNIYTRELAGRTEGFGTSRRKGAWGRAGDAWPDPFPPSIRSSSPTPDPPSTPLPSKTPVSRPEPRIAPATTPPPTVAVVDDFHFATNTRHLYLALSASIAMGEKAPFRQAMDRGREDGRCLMLKRGESVTLLELEADGVARIRREGESSDRWVSADALAIGTPLPGGS